MSRRTLTGATVLAIVVGSPLLLTPPSGASSTSSSHTVHASHVAVRKVGTTQVTAHTGQTQPGAGELRPDPDAASQTRPPVANRSPKSKKSRGPASGPSGVLPTQVLTTASAGSGFQGLDHPDQRNADNGNQYSTAPPDQALCVGNGQVLEGVNTAVRTFDASGNPLTDPISLNRFFWNDSEFDRATGVNSPHQVGDPSCVYDAGSQRFFFTVYDLAGDSAGNVLGPSAVDIAVSPAGTTLGTWSIYQVDTTDAAGTGCPCFGDYPHLGTDANGLYITTNEFSTLGSAFNGAQVYAIDKTALAQGTAALPAAHFDTTGLDSSLGTANPGFALAPALSAGTAYAPSTMYFLSSNAVFSDSGNSRNVVQWTIANTSAIHSDPSTLSLTSTPIPTNLYAVPPPSDQRVGSTPMADCLNVTACAKVLLGKPNRYKEYETVLDSSDSRMLQAAYAHGRLWGALDTAVDVAGATKAGVGYLVADPTSAQVVQQGTLAVAGNNLTYPALGVTSNGTAAMAVTLTGRDYYPSAAWIRLDDTSSSASPVQILGAGQGPYDSFEAYRAYGDPPRPRWGDYGAASVVDGQVWVASEYIAQTCTLAQYSAAPFGSCGGTRTSLSNWSTHVATVTP